MISTEVLEQKMERAHIVFKYEHELAEVYEKACQYQKLVLQYKLYKGCWIIVEPNKVHCIANNTGNVDEEDWIRLQMD